MTRSDSDLWQSDNFPFPGGADGGGEVGGAGGGEVGDDGKVQHSLLHHPEEKRGVSVAVSKVWKHAKDEQSDRLTISKSIV